MSSKLPDSATPGSPEPPPDPSDGRPSDARASTSEIRDPETRHPEDWIPEVYRQLRAAAALQMRGEREGHTLEPTALVHEAFLKLTGERRIPWQNRQHFYVAAAEAMRQILLDHARARSRRKRGGDWRRVPLSLVDVAQSWDLPEIVSLNEALRRLEVEDPEIAAVVRLRFYAGLSIEDASEALAVSPATVKRRWEFGRTWLHRALREEGREEHE